MTDEPTLSGRSAAVRRGFAMRCAVCGHRPIATSPFNLAETCPGCDYRFESEDGFRAGSMTITMATLIVSVIVTLGVFLIAFWPDVPWVVVAICVWLAATAIPILTYAWAKSVWNGIAVFMDPAIDLLAEPPSQV